METRKRNRAEKAELEGLLNLWDLVTLCAMSPQTTADLMDRLEVRQEATRRLRRRGEERFGIEFQTVEVNRDGYLVPAYKSSFGDREKMEDRFKALGA